MADSEVKKMSTPGKLNFGKDFGDNIIIGDNVGDNDDEFDDFEDVFGAQNQNVGDNDAQPIKFFADVVADRRKNVIHFGEENFLWYLQQNHVDIPFCSVGDTRRYLESMALNSARMSFFFIYFSFILAFFLKKK